MGQVMSSVAVAKISWPTWRRVSSSTLRRIGPCMTSWWPCSGVSSSRLPSAPTAALTLITTASRIGSIGGVVTCAERCLEEEKSGGGRGGGGGGGGVVSPHPAGAPP